jgi:hypothetical protein
LTELQPLFVAFLADGDFLAERFLGLAVVGLMHGERAQTHHGRQTDRKHAGGQQGHHQAAAGLARFQHPRGQLAGLPGRRGWSI